MIIQNIKLKKRLFFSDRVLIITDKKKIYFDAEWDENLVNEIDKRLKNFKFENGNDFINLRRKLKDLNDERYSLLEDALFRSVKFSWSFFNPNAVQVPRPLSVVYRKDKGIKEFMAFSLNAKNFLVALDANRHVADRVKKKIHNTDLEDEKEVLLAVKEAIDEEHSLVDFEIRMGVAFDNYKKGKYIYSEKSISTKEQIEFVSNLIENYNLVYVENPFFEGDIKSYKELSDKFRKRGLICMNSKINDYTKGINKKAFNCAVLKFENIFSFKRDADSFKDAGLNIVAEGLEEAMDPAVGLSLPLVRLTDNKKGNAAAERLNRISEEIIKLRQKRQ